MRFSLLLIVVAALAGSAATSQTAVTLPETRVSLTTRGQPLPTLLETLGKQAGVQLTAVQHLADRRATLFAADRPASEVMRALAALWSLPAYPARWRQRQEKSFELWQDARAAQELERIVDADRPRIGLSLDRLVALAMAGDASPAPTGDPIADRFLQPQSWPSERQRFRMLGELPPAARASALNGQQIPSPLDQFTPAIQSWFASANFGKPAGETEEQGLARIQNASFAARLVLDPSFSGWQLEMTRFDPAPGSGAVGTGIPMAPFGVSQPPERDDPADRAAAAAPIDETLARDLRGPVAWKELADFQEFIARGTRRLVVSDYYHDKPAPAPTALAAAKSLGELLNLATAQARYRWHAGPGTLRFRNRYAFLDDRDEAPATMELRLAAAVHADGYLNLDRLAETANLSDKQVARLAAALQQPGLTAVSSYRRELAWYAALDARLRQTVRRPEGLQLLRSGPQAIRIYRAGGEKLIPSLVNQPDPREFKFRFHQEREGEQMVTWIDYFDAHRLWMNGRIFQRILPPQPGSAGAPR